MMKCKLWGKSLLKKEKGFILTEIIIVMAIFSIIASLSIVSFNIKAMENREVSSFIDRLNWEITDERIKSIDLKYSSSLFLDNMGNIYISNNNNLRSIGSKIYMVKNTSYRSESYDFTKSFKVISRSYGNNGFTLEIKKDDKLLGKIVFYVITSTFRDQVY